MSLKARNKINPNFQMSSLTDIIFLLLIFFLLTSSLVSVNALEILLPSSNSSTTVQKGINIAVTGDKQYFYNQEQVDFKEIEGRLIAAKETEEGQTITLFAARSVPWEEVVRIVDLAKRLNLQIIAATNPEK